MGSQKVVRGTSRPSRSERRLWVAAAGWVLLIYSTLYYIRGPIDYLREMNLLRLTVAVVFLLTAATVTFFLVRRRPGWRGWVVLGSFGLIYLWVFLQVEQAEEKFHFIEYGVLAGLIYAALLLRRSRLSGGGEIPPWSRLLMAIAAVILTTALGWGDEGLQAILPNRFYDLRDVGLNAAAAVLAVGAAISWRWAQERTNAESLHT